INGGSIKTTGAQTFNDAVTVGASTNLAASATTFGSTIDDVTANADALTVTGNAVFDGIVGATALKSLHITGTTAFGLGATGVTTSETQAYDGAVTIGTTGAATNLHATSVTFGSTIDDVTANADALTVTGNAVFDGIIGATALHSLHVTGTTALGAGASAVTTSGAQAYDGAVTVAATTAP